MALRIRIERTEGPRSPWRRRGITLGSASVVAAVLASGVAYAFWTGTGTGSATIGSTSAQVLTVASIATPLADLYPTKVDDLGYKLTNPNPYTVQITGLTGATVTSSDPTNCPASNITLPAAALAGMGQPGGWTGIAPVTVNGNSTATGTLTGFVTMAGAAPNGCQAKTFTVNLSFTGTQQ